MRGLLLDTHIWIWLVLGSRDLPRSLRDALEDAAGRLWLSPISLWEAWLLIQKGRLNVKSAAWQWIEEALEEVPLREAPLNFEVVQAVDKLILPHGDPADHFIAATAVSHHLTLVTLDGNLVEAPGLQTLTR